MIQPAIDESTVADTHAIMGAHARRARLCLLLATGLGLYIVVATLVLIVKTAAPPPLVTFLNDGGGEVSAITPHRNPPVTDRQALHWARDKVCDLLSLHFKHYSAQIARRRDYFVGDGWQRYQRSLIDNGTIEQLRREGLIVTAINRSEPRLLRKYRLDGRINWGLEMPILQTVQGASDRPQTMKSVVSVTVEETRRDHAIDGLRIRVFSVKN